MSRTSRVLGSIIAAVLLAPGLAAAQVPSLSLQKFIITDPMKPCPTPDSGVTALSVNSGDQVTYCYVVTNAHGSTNGDQPVTYSTNSLSDTQFGDLTSSIKNESGTTVGGMFDLQGATTTGKCGVGSNSDSHFAYVSVTKTITVEIGRAHV